MWLPLVAGIPLAVCLLLIALPNIGHGLATASRILFLPSFLLWLLPLTLLQRALWRRRSSAPITVAVLLATTAAMALCVRLGVTVLAAAMNESAPQGVNWLYVVRGLEGPWLPLIAYCALHAVVNYYAQFRSERERRIEAQALAREAELLALRYQLQPHFLFNTLNAISSLMANDRPRQAQQMLSRLGEFLRATLDGARGHEVSLADELSLTEAYLDIEQARLGERLRLQWNFGPDLLAARVPYLLFQPLVENAIRHGIAPRSEPGRLDIRVEARDGQLHIDAINDVPQGADAIVRRSDDGTALGLRNTRQRLEKLYPGAHAMDAGLDADGRYRVHLRIPLRSDAAEAGA
ncbi:MAG: histidine kinase [Lysobacter sp.]|nr:histidine kinase [Lysobacter sp.]